MLFKSRVSSRKLLKFLTRYAGINQLSNEITVSLPKMVLFHVIDSFVNEIGFHLQSKVIEWNDLLRCRLFSDKGGGSKKDIPECAKSTNFEPYQLEPCMIDPSKPQPTVVIIGAGMAGLSAAHRLVQCGLRNFTVLEATDRYFEQIKN